MPVYGPEGEGPDGEVTTERAGFQQGTSVGEPAIGRSARTLATQPPPVQARVETDSTVEIGQWYWILPKKGDGEEWFACAKKIGSNFVEFYAAEGGYTRIHADKLFDRVRHEPNPEKVFSEQLAELKIELAGHMAKIQATMARLSLSKDTVASTSTALVAMSSQADPEKYELALRQAKDTELPKLFEEMRETHKSMEKIVQARLIPIEAKIEEMTGVVDHVKSRLFSLSLYAGFSERVKQVRNGAPAKADEVLRIMQRRLYMDEEALLAYEHGGMEFKHIKEFDRWIGKKKNFDRLLPFERCMVAFKVRRHVKDRREIENPFLKIALEDQDELTFIYIRNGQRLFRINTKLKFGPVLFPNRGEFSLTENEPLMVKDSHGMGSWTGEDDELETMPRKSWELSKTQELERREKYDAWDEANPREKWEAERLEELKKEWAQDPEAARRKQNRGVISGGHNGPYVYGWEWERANPFKNGGFAFEKWHPLDSSYVYFDECMGRMKKRVEYYNRIAYIVQGLFDRSEVFNPHVPVNLAHPAGVIELIYDQETLFDGQKPDFQEYCRKLSESITIDSVFFGQEEVWEKNEALKENATMRRRETLQRYRPPGNPGPGRLAKAAKIKKNGEVVFVWYRQRQTPLNRRLFTRQSERIRCSLSVPVDKLLNVSAYQPGDYLQFFRDPRTRAEYLKWAGLLLTAEEYHAGNIKVADTRSPA